MSPDEMSEGLAFEKQLEEMLTFPDGTPKPDGTEILLKFVAVETRYTKKTVSVLTAEFKKLRDEHNQRMLAGVSCAQEDCDETIPKKGKKLLTETTLKILYSTLGIGGVILLVVTLIILKKYGIL